MIRIAPRSTGIAVLVFTLGACGSGTSKAQTTSTSASATTTTSTTTTQPMVDPNAPKPVVGRNGVTVTYATKTSGTITPAKMASSGMTSEFGGTLFRLTHGSDLTIYGAVQGDVYPLLKTRPGWSLEKVSADPTWTPGACSSSPSTVVGDRWMVTAEGADGDDPNNPSQDASFNAYFIRLFDRQTNTFSAITPIDPKEPKRWKGPVRTVGPTEVAIIGESNGGWGKDGNWAGKADVIRTINLQTMTFHDDPYVEPPPPADPFTARYSTDGEGVTVLTSATTGKKLQLSNIGSVSGLALPGNRAVVAYDNGAALPSRVSGQVGIWDMSSGAWDRALDSGSAPDPGVNPKREDTHGTGVPGFAVWFADISQKS
jgi:hypothetical protein